MSTAPPPYTPDGDALRIATTHSQDIRFDTNAGLWRRYTGTHWVALPRPARGHGGYDPVQEFVRDSLLALHHAEDPTGGKAELEKHRRRAADSKYRDSVLRSLSQQLVLQQDKWDHTPLSIATSSGLVDLRTGTLIPHQREHYCTSFLRTPYDPNVDMTEWDALMSGWFGDDEELKRYVQIALGYSILGDPREKLLFLLHGETNTGKSTFLAMVNTVFADLVGHLPELWNSSNTRALNNGFARVEKTHLVIVPDAPPDMKWGTSEVKTITGASDADQLISKSMYKDARTYTPKFTVWGTLNELPRIPRDDEAVWGRVRVIPFGYRREKNDWNMDLGRRAKHDHPRSLAPMLMKFAVDGCREYLSVDRIAHTAEAVVLTTQSARDQGQDVEGDVRAWMREHVIPAPHGDSLVPEHVIKACQRHATARGARLPGAKIIRDLMVRRYGAAESTWINGRNIRAYRGCQWAPAHAPEPELAPAPALESAPEERDALTSLFCGDSGTGPRGVDTLCSWIMDGDPGTPGPVSAVPQSPLTDDQIISMFRIQ